MTRRDDRTVRAAAVAGLFYPAAAQQLAEMVEALLAGGAAGSRRAVAVVVPHAGLKYSGACAARVWRRVKIPRTCVIVGPNHRGAGDNPAGVSVWERGAFATPLGNVPIAEEFVAQLAAEAPFVRHDPTAHSREHAVEVQLPFLRAIAPDTTLAPILLAFDDWERCRAVAHALAAVVARHAAGVLLVASSDMTHYESAASAERKDRLALAEIERIDGEALLRVCRRERITMCGRAPVAVILEAARRLGASSAQVIDYRHSGWVTGDDGDVVAYAGVVIE